MLASRLIKNSFLYDYFCLGKKFLVYNMVGRNLKIKYRRSVLGIFWTLLAPAGMGVVYFYVFTRVMKVQIPYYLPFVLSGTFCWTFFSSTVLESMDSIVGNMSLLSKIPIPVQVFPFVTSVTNVITLFLASLIMIASALIAKAPIGPAIFLLPLFLSILFFMAYSLGLTLAIAYVWLRDLRHAMTIIFQVWFYATPVIYGDSMIPERFKWILLVNPIGTIFKNIHNIMTSQIYPTRQDLLVTLGWCLLMIFLSDRTLKHFRSGLVERL